MVQSAGIDETLTETPVENKAACAEETEATSKYVVSEDMEVIDDLEEGSEGGSNDSGDFTDADEGTATPSSSGTSKSESGRVLFMLYYVHKTWQLPNPVHKLYGKRPIPFKLHGPRKMRDDGKNSKLKQQV